ncbi:MAG: hypothetical protein ACM3UR_15995, partial [Bacteroidota bacterium]
NIFSNYLPKELYLLASLSAALILMVVWLLIESIIQWRRMLLKKPGTLREEIEQMAEEAK